MLASSELTASASKTIKVSLSFILWHVSRQCPPNGNHSRRMCAYKQRLWTGGITVRARDEVPQAICDTVVELRNTLSLRARHNHGVLLGVQVRKVRVEDLDTCWRRMVEASQAVELADTRLDVYSDFLLAVAKRKGIGKRREGLQTAVER